jgi:hypothetical protein
VAQALDSGSTSSSVVACLDQIYQLLPEFRQIRAWDLGMKNILLSD